MLKHRLLSAFIIIIILVCAFCLKGLAGDIVFLLFAIFMLSKGVCEFLTMSSKFLAGGHPVLVALCAALPLLGAFAQKHKGCGDFALVGFSASLALLLIGSFSRCLRAEDLAQGIKDVCASLAAYTYTVLPISFLALVYFDIGLGLGETARPMVIFLVAVTKASDIGAYTVGMTSHRLSKGGNHKIAPRLSPGKSWEGFGGGIAFSVGTAFLLLHLYPQLSAGPQFMDFDAVGAGLHRGLGLTAWDALFFGIAGATLGYVGDVSESVMKRVSGMKDSGSILPGMGGILDVLDSLVLVAPLFYCYLLIRLH